MAKKQYSRAAIQFKNAVQLLPKDAEAEYQLALAYLADGKPSQAVAALTRVTQLNPKHALAQVKLADLMVHSGDTAAIQQGERRMEDLLTTSPENVDALDTLALSEIELNKPQDAERRLRAALQNLPRNLKSSLELATLYLSQNKPDAAEETLKKAASEAPRNADAAVALGELYLLTHRWTEAEGEFRQALQLHPAEARALLGLAAVQVQLGQPEAEQTYRTVASLPGKRYRHLHAVYLFAAGKRDAAVKEFETLAKESPNDRDSRGRLVTAYLLSGRGPDAERVLNSALKANARDVDALLQRSQIFVRSGRDRKAEADLNEVLHYRPDSADAHYLLSRIYSRRGDALRRRSELTEALRYNAGMLPARTELAQLLTLSNSSSAALDLLDSAPPSQKEALPVIVQRNLAKFAAGDKEGFRAGVSAGLKIARTPDLLLQDAALKLFDKNYSGARSSLEEALRQNPDDLRALRGIAIGYAAEKRPAEATRFLQQYAAQHAKSAAVQQFLGEWLWAAGAHTEARAAYAAAKTADPNYVPADLALARADLMDGKLDSARVSLNRLVSADNHDVAAQSLLAIAETRAGNYPAALAQYRKAVALNPRDPVALNNLAYLLADFANQPDEALPYAQHALEAAPENADAAGTLGWIFYRKGLYESARQYLQKAVLNDHAGSGRNAVIRKYHLAMAYLKLGDRKRGADALTVALQQDANLPEAQMARAVLSESGR